MMKGKGTIIIFFLSNGKREMIKPEKWEKKLRMGVVCSSAAMIVLFLSLTFPGHRHISVAMISSSGDD